jgi:hypothetical protein
MADQADTIGSYGFRTFHAWRNAADRRWKIEPLPTGGEEFTNEEAKAIKAAVRKAWTKYRNKEA